MISDLLNSYQSTRVFGTGHHSLPFGGFGGILIWLSQNLTPSNNRNNINNEDRNAPIAANQRAKNNEM